MYCNIHPEWRFCIQETYLDVVVQQLLSGFSGLGTQGGDGGHGAVVLEGNRDGRVNLNP